LGGVDEGVEAAVEKGDDDERVKSDHIDAYYTHCYQNCVYLVRQV